MQEIRCKLCGKVLLEASSGEIKKKCPKCKEMNHVIVTSVGIFSVEQEGLVKK